jgi:hypothetical protein
MTIKSILKRFIPISYRVALRKAYYKLLHWWQWLRVKDKSATFIFNGKTYSYFIHPYNTTWKNERAIEAPIIRDLLIQYSGKPVLEIGNVMSHYFPSNYTIVDKYEKGKGVRNCDILDFLPPSPVQNPYSLVISISTFEHIGFDETKYGQTKNEDNVMRAIEKTKTLLSEDGIFVMTVPLGFNPFLDEKIDKNLLGLSEMLFLKRITKDNKWVQVDYNEVKNIKYGYPFPCANGLMIGIYDGRNKT